MKISAAICTHNRAEYLRAALESLLHQTLLPAEFEIIVIDNASTDDTREVVETFQPRFLNTVYFFESGLGLCRARNRAVELARSPYIAFLDDDGQAVPIWLESLLGDFEVASVQPACIGGKTLLEWGTAPPAWLPAEWWSVYTRCDLGDSAHEVGKNEYLVGANIAFRIDILKMIGGFDDNLSRAGRKLRSGDEAKAIEQIRNIQGIVLYEPAATVYHTVLKERQRRSWLIRRVFWDGASQPYLDYGPGRPRSFYLAKVLWDCRVLLGNLGALLVNILRCRGRHARLDLLSLVQRIGRLRANFGLAMKPC